MLAKWFNCQRIPPIIPPQIAAIQDTFVYGTNLKRIARPALVNKKGIRIDRIFPIQLKREPSKLFSRIPKFSKLFKTFQKF